MRTTSSGFCPGVIGKYKKQCDELTLFYKQYNLQLQESELVEKVMEGHLGVINYIRAQGLGKGILPEDLSRKAEELGAEFRIMEFFNKLKNELEKERL